MHERSDCLHEIMDQNVLTYPGDFLFSKCRSRHRDQTLKSEPWSFNLLPLSKPLPSLWAIYAGETFFVDSWAGLNSKSCQPEGGPGIFCDCHCSKQVRNIRDQFQAFVANILINLGTQREVAMDLSAEKKLYISQKRISNDSNPSTKLVSSLKCQKKKSDLACIFF